MVMFQGIVDVLFLGILVVFMLWFFMFLEGSFGCFIDGVISYIVFFVFVYVGIMFFVFYCYRERLFKELLMVFWGVEILEFQYFVFGFFLIFLFGFFLVKLLMVYNVVFDVFNLILVFLIIFFGLIWLGFIVFKGVEDRIFFKLSFFDVVFVGVFQSFFFIGGVLRIGFVILVFVFFGYKVENVFEWGFLIVFVYYLIRLFYFGVYEGDIFLGFIIVVMVFFVSFGIMEVLVRIV